MNENLSGGHRTADSGRTARLLRYTPPAAALGTAFVLQIVVVTDLLGGALADRFHTAWAYTPAVMFGLAVATSLEGGAAYLMDLYDKHLLARDNTLWLRVLMVVYVAGSAAAIHWWADTRGLPTIMSWLLAGMSASALFLWSRGSRWQHREAMRAAGQIDPALPRLPMASKLLHPVRWLVTLWLISWEPVSTTSQARARYRTWKDRQAGKASLLGLDVQLAMFLTDGCMAVRRIETERELSAVREQVAADLYAQRLAVEAEVSAVQAQALSAAAQIRTAADLYAERVRTAADGQAEAVRADSDRTAADAVRRTEEAYSEADRIVAVAKKKADSLIAAAADTRRAVRPPATNGDRRTPPDPKAEVSVEQLADSLDKRFPDSVPGRPTAIEHLKKVFGSCSNDRARAAIQVLSARRESAPADEERSPETPTNESIGALQ